MTARLPALSDAFLAAIADQAPVRGLTHNFYKYPARFSPRFVRAAIEEFSEPGDLVVDTFLGGGTSAVEAIALGRGFVGTDISRLAHFVSAAKTTFLPEAELEEVVEWFEAFRGRATSRERAIRPTEWITAGYQRHLVGQDLWRIRKAIEIALAEIERFSHPRQVRFARAVVLRTAQSALDTRKSFPSVVAFRNALAVNASAMAAGLTELFATARTASPDWQRLILRRTEAEHLPDVRRSFNLPAPRLVLTSPPYPGVHVLYHRWQVRGGRETPAPFWIADVLDGDPTSYYTLADRHNEEGYFRRLSETLAAIRSVCDTNTVMVQMLAFRDAAMLLPRYLEAMADAGFETVEQGLALGESLQRAVPSRRWYTASRGGTSDSGREFVLVHRPC